MTRLSLSFLALLSVAGCAHRNVGALATGSDDVGWFGPNDVELDLLRTEPGGNRIFVQATLPDGEAGLFLVDTGAAISVLSEGAADRLGLEIESDWGVVEGLGGRAGLHRAVIPALDLGDAIVPEVEFAVGVPGVPEKAGAMPLDGILGNNVWSRFVVEIDYPADLLVLHRPGTLRIPRRADLMFFDGAHVFAPVEITTSTDPPETDRVVIQVDTGATGLMLAGSHGRHFESAFTEGLEPIFGIGASEILPPSQFLQTTRRIPIDSVVIGGRRVEVDTEARWVNFEGNASIGPKGLKGLAGHELLQGNDVVFDYQGGRILLRKSRRKPRQLDGHELMLARDVALHGDDPSRYLYRATLNVYLGNEEEADALLDAFVRSAASRPDEDPERIAEARVLLAGVRRVEGDLEGAWEALAPLAPDQLVDQAEIVATVNGLLLAGKPDEALALADAAVAARPGEGWAHVARSDALYATGRHEEAREAIAEAARLAENPDAHLLRRARISLAQGDRYGALAQIRDLLELYPNEGLVLWFYAELLDEDDVETFRSDMERAMARLHPSDRPLDFMVASLRALGEDGEARRLMDEGISRDCEDAPTEPSENNCVAWYYALAGIEPAEALHRIDAALAETGDRPDFLDTKAMVHLSRGEIAAARDAALAAARLSPDDVYMLWQAERLSQMAETAKESP